MTPFRHVNYFNVSPAEFLIYSNEQELLDYLARVGGLSQRKVYGRVETDTTVSWRVDVALTENMPPWLQRLFPSDRLKFTNVCVFDKASTVTTWQITDASIDKYLKVGGRVRLEEPEPGRTAMVMEGQAVANVPMFAKKLEEFVAERSVASWDRDARTRGQYIDLKQAEKRGHSAPYRG